MNDEDIICRRQNGYYSAMLEKVLRIYCRLCKNCKKMLKVISKYGCGSSILGSSFAMYGIICFLGGFSG
jgi:hypothetical protein